MSQRLNQPWLPLDRVAELFSLEPLVIILALALVSWLIYKTFLRQLSSERHKSLREQFRDLVKYSVAWILGTVSFIVLNESQNLTPLASRAAPYIGTMALILGAVVFVKTSKIIVFEYLFYKNMTVGVPVLVVNVFTMLLSLFLGGWLASELFNLKVVPLLATSAIFSVVLGLALQDTLGNLFSGLSLQVDKPYSIGDWIEVQSGGFKWVGEIIEISWRSTVLKGFADELQTIPNRIMAGAQIANFATKEHPIWRSQIFKIAHGHDQNQVKEILLSALQGLPEILKSPEPLALIAELNESWVAYRLAFCIRDYGAQFIIADHVLSTGLALLEKNKIQIAAQRVEVLKSLT